MDDSTVGFVMIKSGNYYEKRTFMSKNRQTYKYIKNNSILGDLHDDYHLSQEEFYKLYSFYVTFSMCGNQSAKKRTFMDYGWPSDAIDSSELGGNVSECHKL